MTQNPFIQSQLEAFGECAAANLNDGEHPIPENGRMVQLAYAVEVTQDFLASSLRAAIAEGRSNAVDDILAKFPKEDTEDNWRAFTQVWKPNEIVESARLEKPNEGTI